MHHAGDNCSLVLLLLLIANLRYFPHGEKYQENNTLAHCREKHTIYESRFLYAISITTSSSPVVETL